MTITPNLYGFATKELAQDATIAYLLAWADPAYRESHPRLHTLGSELLRSLLQTQEVDLPQIETLCIGTQVYRIDIVVLINAGERGILLIIEDKVSAQEGPNQIEGYIETAREKYSGQYDRDRLVAVYLKTGNESKASLPDKDKCGRFMRRDLLDILNRFQDTGNVIVDDFRIHLQGWEDETNRWKSASYDKWEWTQWEGFYADLEHRWDGYCAWDYIANPAGGFLACWLGLEDIETENGYATLYMQIHDAKRLTVRLGSGTAVDKVRAPFMYQVLDALNEEDSDDIRIEKAGTFRGGGAAAVANVTFDEQGPWFAVDRNGVLDMDATIERLRRLEELLQKVATRLTEQGIVS
ncbi:MAG: hypothetical protein F4Z85_20930 [Gemmatimonadetes bacterium]|nr:hypothetical protein [Gemmatimonadota bacterium]MYB67925.1 hypothetical protein [Gemmatimonadota bacterium]